MLDRMQSRGDLSARGLVLDAHVIGPRGAVILLQTAPRARSRPSTRVRVTPGDEVTDG